jgi:hypothetical protein
MSPNRFLVSVLYLLSLALLASAQSLSFLEPPTLWEDEASLQEYVVGQNMNVSWHSDFESTTLIVFQQRQDGSYASQVVAGTAS